MPAKRSMIFWMSGKQVISATKPTLLYLIDLLSRNRGLSMVMPTLVMRFWKTGRRKRRLTRFLEEYAGEYLSHHGDLWEKTPEAISFVNWLYHHSEVLIERAEILSCQEELLWEQDGEKRNELIEREHMALKKIDDTLSKRIIQKRRERDGRKIYPWQYTPFNPMHFFS